MSGPYCSCAIQKADMNALLP